MKTVYIKIELKSTTVQVTFINENFSWLFVLVVDVNQNITLWLNQSQFLSKL